MTTYKATSTVPWRRREVLELSGTWLVAITAWVLLFTGAIGSGWNGLLIGIGILSTVVGIYGLFAGFGRKRRATQFAEMNTDGWRFQWWARKPLKAVWGERLNPVYNQGRLEEIRAIALIKVGKHDVLEFTNAADKKYSLPLRLANTDGVRDFLLAWVEHHLHGRVPVVNQQSMIVFAGVLNRGRFTEPVEQPEVDGDTDEGKAPVEVDPR